MRTSPIDPGSVLPRATDGSRPERSAPTEQALCAGEARFRTAFEHAAVGLAVTDPSGRFLLVNAAFCAITGYSEQELATLDFATVTHPDDRARNLASTDRLLKGEIASFEIEKRYRRRDGSLVWVQNSVSLTRDEHGYPVNIIALAQDITARKQAEEERQFHLARAQAAEARYRGLFDASADAILVANPEGRYVDANPAAEVLLGYSREELLGLQVRDLVVPDPATGPEELRRFFLTGQGRTDREVLHKDGRLMPVEARGATVQLPDGPHVTVALRDISAGRQAEKALRESEERYRQIVETAQEGVWILDGAANTTYVNARMAAMLGYRPDEMIGQPLQAFLDPAFHQWATEAVQRRWHGYIGQADFRYRHKDGHDVWGILTTNPIKDEQGHVTALLGMVTDITERKAAEMARQELERRLALSEKLSALGQLAAGAAHDINNALAAIVGPLEMIKAGAADGTLAPDRLRLEVDFVLRAAEDAAQTVRRLQGFARQDGAATDPHQAIVVPDDVLDDVIAFARPRWRDQAQAEGRHITIDVRRGGAPAVLVDPAELREMLINLVNNAADALPFGGRITLAACPERNTDGTPCAAISVTDTGIGMDEATRRRIFEPFFTTKPYGKGTGLGLAMVHGIVERLHGAIDVASAPQQGTVFTVRLPACTAEARTAEAVDPPTPPMIARRVLLVEDEVGLRAVATRLLERAGHAVAVAASAREALAYLDGWTERRHVDIVVTDIGLPDRSGWHVATWVREQCAGLPVVLATGWASSLSDADLAAAGVPRQQVVSKPYLLADLQRAFVAAVPPA